MKKLFKFLLWLVLFLFIAVAVGSFVFLKTFDLNKYKSYVQDIVYNQTGRKLSLGEAGLKISLIPTVVLNDVALSNAEWAESEYMVRAKSIEVSMDVLPLLKKQLVINTVELVDPEVNLEVNKDGTANWTFSTVKEDNKETTEQSAQTTGQDVAKTAAVMGVVAKHLQIDNGSIVYRDLKSGNTQNVKIQSFNLNSDGMDDNINMEFEALYNNQSVTGTAVTGSVNSILQNKPDFPLQADVKAFGITAQTDLKLNNLTGNPSFAGNVKITNPAGNFGAPEVKLDADADGNAKTISVVIKKLELAKNTVEGNISVNLAGAKPYVKANLSSALIDIESFTVKQNAALDLALIGTADAAGFVPDTTLDLQALNSVNANAELKIKQLKVNSDISLNNILLTAVLNNGKLTVNPLSMNAGGGVVSGSVSVSSANKISADLTGKDIVLQNVLTELSHSNNGSFGIDSGGKTDLKIKLDSYGSTLRKLVENLSGQIVAVVGESQIKTGSLKYLDGNLITQILNSLNLKTSNDMSLECAVVRTDIADGKAQFPKGVVFNAKQLVVVGDGSLNLVNDKLNFSLHPFNNKLTDTNIAQAITSLLKISGTVENPKVTLDNASVIKNVVGVAAVGPAYLGSEVLLDGDSSPCYTALKGTSYQSMFPAPSGTRATGQGIYQGTSEIIDDSVSTLKDTAKDVLKLLKGKK